MSKICEFKNKVCDYVKNHNYIKYVSLALVIVLILSGVYFFNKDKIDNVLLKNFSAFEVSA